jgi:superfamily I DNA/RNA helicase/DNA polymerase III epsilon subunit-like protein
VSLIPTPAQRRAIEAPLGPVLVVAGPGSGKTFCLIERVRYLAAVLGIDPSRICAVTFTNKAAEELAARLERTLGARAEEVARGTLHRLCLAMLRDFPAEAGLRDGFGIADDEYQKQLARRIGARGDREARWLLTLFGRHRLQGLQLAGRDADRFARYRDALRARNLVDFDDIIALTEALLRENPAIAVAQARRWDALLVDELQDLSTAHYAIVRKLSQGGCLFGVGDDEQSIYGWAGADPHVLKRFQQDFEIRQPIVIEENRRCSTRILEVARRLIARNPTLFDKVIASNRDGEHDVEVLEFESDADEAAWLVGDLERDREATGLPWGEYAVLYRKHQAARALEPALLERGLPCRLARGQALLDDRVLASVVSSLQVIAAPHDPTTVEVFACRVLPSAMVEQVRLGAPAGSDFLTALRRFARRSGGDPDGRKAWRFIHHVENLRALARSHDALGPLVAELLATLAGRYQSPLEERFAELSDPLECPGASDLAGRLAAAIARGGTIWLTPHRGVEFALLGMLEAAGIGPARRIAGPQLLGRNDLVLRSEDAGDGCWPLVVFKALQLLHTRDLTDRLRDYVAFDLETSDREVGSCGIVEIAAVRVRNGVIVEQFHELVNPGRPIHPAATRVHGYSDADVRDVLPLPEVWSRFREFVGHDRLVAHNGTKFDVPVLRRCAAGLPGVDDLVFFDTLPLARLVVDGSAKLSDLARRFGLDAGRSHHALDDASTLAGVLHHLSVLRLRRARIAAVGQALGHLGLALALDHPAGRTPEERLLRELALPASVGRYGTCLECYDAARAACDGAHGDAPPLAELIERLGGQELVNRIRARRSPAERYPTSVARLQSLVAASAAAGPSLSAQLGRMLELVALSTSEGVEKDPQRLSLLTLHSTKGLEFSRVYILGVEDNELPGWRAMRDGREDEIREARRLLYVGMTRAKDRLVLTRVRQRQGNAGGGEMFLREMGLSLVTSTARSTAATAAPLLASPAPAGGTFPGQSPPTG